MNVKMSVFGKIKFVGAKTRGCKGVAGKLGSVQEAPGPAGPRTEP